MYAPGHFTKNQYGSYGAMKGYQDQQQSQRNQMTVGGSRGVQSPAATESPVGEYTQQLMQMLGAGGGSSKTAPRTLYGSSNASPAVAGATTGTAPMGNVNYTQIVPTTSGLPGAQPYVDQYRANMDTMMAGAGGPLTKALRGMQDRGSLELQRLINPAQSELDFQYSRGASDEGIGQQRFMLNRQTAENRFNNDNQGILLSLLMGGI